MPTRSFDEKQAIRQAQQGEAEAIGSLYRRHAEAIYRYCLLRVGDEAAAEDLTAQVFLTMVEALPRYADRGAPFAAFLFKIAHDRVVDYYRRAERRPTVSLAESLADKAPGPEAQATRQFEARRLKQAIRTLTDDQQTVIQLRFVEGYNLEETARIVGKTTGAVKSLQHRALSSLARKLKP